MADRSSKGLMENRDRRRKSDNAILGSVHKNSKRITHLKARLARIVQISGQYKICHKTEETNAHWICEYEAHPSFFVKALNIPKNQFSKSTDTIILNQAYYDIIKGIENEPNI